LKEFYYLYEVEAHGVGIVRNVTWTLDTNILKQTTHLSDDCNVSHNQRQAAAVGFVQYNTIFV